MKEEIDERLVILHNVLVYCSEVDRLSDGKYNIFSLVERIFINQERGALFSQLAGEKGEIFPHEVRTYKVPEQIERKIKLTKEQIEATNWGGFTKDQLLKTQES